MNPIMKPKIKKKHQALKNSTIRHILNERIPDLVSKFKLERINPLFDKKKKL